MTGIKLFLDDVREPRNCVGYMHQRIGPENFLYMDEWVIVKNYDEFVEAVKKYGDQISHISFDHDLSDEHYSEIMDNPEEYNKLKFKEKTGADCARWLRDYMKGTKWYPRMFVHSMNPVGTQNIINIFKEEYI